MRNMVAKIFTNQKYICLLFLLGGGLISSLLQYELLWDFVNYHYYNAWAFWNNRFNQDPLMAGLNGFFNPLPDVPLYLLIKYFNDYPTFIYFVQGLWFGALMYVVYRLELLFFDVSITQGKVKALVCFVIAMTGNATFLQIGTSTNEIMLAFFYLLSFYLLINEIFYKQTGNKLPFICSGFLLGAAMGLKLTGVLYCVVSGLVLILFYKKIKNPFVNIFCFTLFGVIGFLSFAGWWMWILWQEFQNPFYPFANALFKSEWLTFSDFSDHNFRPKNWMEFLFWPFILSLTLYRPEGNGMFVSDFRFLIVYLVFLYFIVKWIYQYCRYKKIDFNAQWAFLIVYLLILYVFWTYFFSISRYFVVGEILIAFVITQALFSKNFSSVLGKGLYFSFDIFILFVLLSTPYFSYEWGSRADWKERYLSHDAYIGIEKLNIPDDALIQTYNYPTAAFFAFWADKQPSLKGVNIYQQLYYRMSETSDFVGKDFFRTLKPWQQKRDEIVAQHKGPKLLLVANGMTHRVLNMDFIRHEAARGMSCYFLYNNLLSYISLCAPKEIADQVFVNKGMRIYEDKN